ncbi:hypothetical protein F5B19DRAFT_470013 [Rostrohypoxylon terebratum]|nr:hypothetical protein F5B19DRAFT_470013 [Rostrohypoxylon terebratum]
MTSDSLKLKVYRLRGCPGHLDRLGAAELLSRELGDIAPTDIAIKSLATSLHSWTATPTKVGTLMFHKVPALLGEREKETEWKLSVVGLEEDLILDIHFLGMTPLNDVQLEKHKFDCIAISGLASHPFGSWQPKGKDKSFMWIRDELPRLVPELRTSIYGYDTTLAGSNSFQSIQDLATSLLDHIQSSGWILPSAKPLIFLAHSLGGIILKEAFTILADSGDRNSHILSLFRGGIFFGVPGQGMHTSHLLAMVKSHTNESMIQDLSEGSEYLRALDDKFSGLYSIRHMRLHLAYETKTSPTIMKREDGSFSRTGSEQILVSKESATRSLYSSLSPDIFPVNENHSNMVKFRKDDPNLRIVANRLRMLCQGDDRRSNGIVGANTRTRIVAQPYEVMGDADTMGRNGIGEPRSGRTRGRAIEDLKKSLKIPGENSRFETIEQPFEDTFGWAYDTKINPLANWLGNQEGFFWICGKPGSGKSTLMKFIANEKRTWECLNKSSSGAVQISAKFFFDYHGAVIQRSFEGLLRSVLCQIIEQFESSNVEFPQLIEPLMRHQAQTSRDAHWPLGILESSLHCLLRQNHLSLSVFFLLDALDEYDGQPEFIGRFLEDLMGMTTNSRTKLKILFSSRPGSEFTRQFKHVPSIRLEKYTRADIQNYCDSIVDSIIDGPSDVLTPIISKVVDRADGVFLWARLIMNDFPMEARRGTGATYLINELKTSVIEEGLMKAFLSPPDPSTIYNSAIALRLPEPHERLFQHEAYVAWEREENSFLWIHGPPGSGKTVLSSAIIRNLQNAHPNDVVYFYFDFIALNKQRYEDMLRSLIDQLCNKREDLRWHLDSLYFSCDNGKRQPSPESLCNIMQSMAQEAGEIWMVIDALDECSSALDGIASESLQWVQNPQYPLRNIHLLITSRPNEDIESIVMERITQPNMISLQDDIVHVDIRHYIHTNVQGLMRWQSQPEVQKEIESLLIEKANGRFLWVKHRFDELRQCPNYDSVLKVISSDADVDIDGDGNVDVDVDSASETLTSVRDNDSIFSSGSVLSSMSSAPSIKEVDVLVGEFSSLLFQDELIRSVISSALLLESVGFVKMKRNFRRLLGRCASDLKKEPSNNNYREHVVHFVKRYSFRITEELLARFPGETKKLIPKDLPSQDALEKVERYLDQMHKPQMAEVSTSFSQNSDQDSDQDSDQESDSVDEEIDDDEPTQPGSLIMIKQFISKSVAYESLRRELYEFVHPNLGSKLRNLVDRWSQPSHKHHAYVACYRLSNLVTELQDVDLRKIQFHEEEGGGGGEEEEASYLRRFISYYQEVIERRSGERWDWWPLPPYLKVLKKGEVRLRWECPCGEKRWTEVPKPFAEHLQSIIHNLIHHHHHPPAPLLPSYATNPPQTLNTQAGQGVHGNSNGLGQRTRNAGGASTSNVHVLQPGASPQQPNDQSSHGSNRRIILIVNRGRDYKIVQIRVDGDTNRTFFRQLRKEYFRLRGFIRGWCSVWTYSHCDFYKCHKHDDYDFEPMEQHQFPDPANADYEYQPRPMIRIPPVTAHQFYKRFYACHLLPYRFLHFYHECRTESECTKKSLLHSFPMKKTELKEIGDDDETFWAIYAREHISLAMVCFYNFVCAFPLLVFCIAWSIPLGRGTDLQNPSVPLMIMMTMLSLFWSTYYGNLEVHRRSH